MRVYDRQNKFARYLSWKTADSGMINRFNMEGLSSSDGGVSVKQSKFVRQPRESFVYHNNWFFDYNLLILLN